MKFELIRTDQLAAPSVQRRYVAGEWTPFLEERQ